jgi:hypothetical protein
MPRRTKINKLDTFLGRLDVKNVISSLYILNDAFYFLLTLNDIENAINTYSMTLNKSKAVPTCHYYVSQVRPPQGAVVRAFK